MSKPQSVTVIGAGIVGICTTLSLLERGQKVLLIDRKTPAAGASHGNAGVISPWSCTPLSVPGLWKKLPVWLMGSSGPVRIRPEYGLKFLPWAIRFLKAGKASKILATGKAMRALHAPGIDLYRKFLRGTGEERLVVASNYIHVYRSEKEARADNLVWRIHQDFGTPIENISGYELREIEPDISSAIQFAVLIKSIARTLDPGKLVKALTEKAISSGAEFRPREVLALQPNGTYNWRIITNTEEIASDKVIITAGAWSTQLLKPLCHLLPLEADRGYHVNIRKSGISINNSIMDSENKFVVSQMNMGIRSAGTSEFAGIDAKPNYARAKKLLSLTRRLFPKVNLSDVEFWSGLRPSFPDSLPCIGTVPGQRGLYVAFGHGHYGLGMAPETGQIVAQLVTGQSPKADIEPYDIRRF